jgi:hypothetical protein
VEFGVAGGDGLVALESLSKEIAAFFGINIDVFGFDTGEGMPMPTDYRDLPHVWSKGFYRMDKERLRKRLNVNTRLFIGDVGETVHKLVEARCPLGFVAFDMDYYSSTKEALRAFDLPQFTRLPRIYCYFDDILYPELACHNHWIGELCAIREFNDEHSDKKLGALNLLRWLRPRPEPWNDQIYVLHDFHHPLYSVHIMREE